MQDPQGRREMDADSDFTKAFIFNMTNFIDEIDDRFKRFEAPRSIPEVMAMDKEIASNPLRLWLNRTKTDGRGIVKRIKIIPDEVRESNKIEFFSFTIQGAQPSDVAITEKADAPITKEVEEEDEGVFMEEAPTIVGEV